MSKPKPMLMASRLREVLHYDQNTGVFTWIVTPNAFRGSVRIGDIAGYKSRDGYIKIGVDGCAYQAHRLAWLYMHGSCEHNLDHKDGQRDHNWIGNLRPATYAQNNQNRRARLGSKSGLLGAFKHNGRNRWFAQITVNGKQKHIGCYATPEEAHAAYLFEKVRLHPFQNIVNVE